MILVLVTEVDPAYEYLPTALTDLVRSNTADEVRTRNVPRDGLPAPESLDDLDAVVVSGSTAGVYERDTYDFIPEAEAFVRRLVDARVPTLAICFGHQLVNAALGGRVEHRGLTTRLVEAEFADDPLFEGVAPTVPAVHGDAVTETGTGMDVVGSTDHAPVFATRHRTAPVWSTQYHPEFTVDLHPRVEEAFGWTETGRGWEAVTADRTVRNFLELAEVD